MSNKFLRKTETRRFLSTCVKKLATIEVFPKKSLVDERLTKTVVKGLKPEETVKLKLSVTNKVNLNYASAFDFQADKQGVIDLSKTVPKCQTYNEPDPMSIYWLMKPQEGSDKRFWPLKINNGLECKYEVFSQNNESLACDTIYKDYMGEGVQRIEIREGNIVGTLFLPPGHGPFPCVIKLYGGIHKGNVIEDKSAMFASRGIASLALAFFGVPGLPKTYADKPMEMSYFEEAIDFLCSKNQIKSDKGIGVCGISKGAVIALTLSSILPPSKLGAIAAMNFLVCPAGVDVIYQGKTIAKAHNIKKLEKYAKEVAPNVYSVYHLFHEDYITEGTLIPFFKSKVPMFFIAGLDDQHYSSIDQARIAEKLMQKYEKQNYKLGEYDGLGHLIDTPFAPATNLAKHPLFPKSYYVNMGGDDPIKHGRSQEQVWRDLVQYFHEHL